MSHTYSTIYYHVIHSTRDRTEWIGPELEPPLFAYVSAVIESEGGKLLEAGAMPDHVHWLVSGAPKVAVSDLVRSVKANSSRWIHETFPTLGDFAWQSGYGVFSVSESGLDRVRRYIRGQKEHHRKMTFKEEYIAFLKRHQIEYDERYVWG